MVKKKNIGLPFAVAVLPVPGLSHFLEVEVELNVFFFFAPVSLEPGSFEDVGVEAGRKQTQNYIFYELNNSVP